MASTRLKTTKDGRDYYEIRVHPSNGKEVTRRWYVPAGWSKRAIERELAKVSADIERQVKDGDILSRAEAKAEAEARVAEEAKILTVKQYAERVFMPALTVRCSEHTRANYQGNLDNWIYPAIGDRKLPDVTAAQINALLLDMQKQGKAQGTCVKCYTILSGIFKSAFMDDSISINPMLKVQRPKPRKDEKKSTDAEAYTIDEARQLITALDAEPLKWKTLINLLLETGVRRGEACGLQWTDVDFAERTIAINRNLCYSPQKGVYVDTPKNGHTRTVPVGDDMLKLLRQLRSEQASSFLSRWIFTQDGSPEPMHPDSPTRYLQKLSKRTGISGLHPHKLRHTFASIAITNGADIASVSETLGHSDKAVTLRMYTHADEESKRRATNIFREALRQKEA